MKPSFHKLRTLAVLSLGLTAALSHAGGKLLNIGDAAPPMKVGKWLKGTPVPRFEPGKVYVVEFWATWCGPCKAAMPHLSELAKKYQGQVTFSGVSVWERGDNVAKQVESFVKGAGDRMSYNVAADTAESTMANTWLRAAGESGIPCSFIVGKDGKIAWIGHPMKLDDVLPKVVAGEGDFKSLAQTRSMSKQPTIQDGEAEVLAAFQTAMNKKDYPGAVAAIDAGIAKNPSLSKTLWYPKLQALVHVDDDKARSVAQEAIKDTTSPGSFLNRLKAGATLAMADGMSKATYDFAIDCLKKVKDQGDQPASGGAMSMHVNTQALDKMIELATAHASKAKS